MHRWHRRLHSEKGADESNTFKPLHTYVASGPTGTKLGCGQKDAKILTTLPLFPLFAAAAIKKIFVPTNRPGGVLMRPTSLRLVVVGVADRRDGG